MLMCSFNVSFSGKDFLIKCNKESVDVELVEDPEDLTWLQNMLQEFTDATGSEVAQRLLQNWPDAAKDFVKVGKNLTEEKILEFLR